MDKDQFLFLATHFDSLTADETVALEAVQKEFPYCQVAHALATRGAQQHRSDIYQKQLHLSAVYATDRAVLKSILAHPAAERHTETANHLSSVDAKSAHTLDGEDLVNEVMADLSKLKELKHNFEMSLDAYHKSVGQEKESKSSKRPAVPATPPGPVAAPSDKEPEKKNDSLADLIDEEPSGDALLDEIRNKKKIRPEGSRQKEQIEIINQFIKKQPTISKVPVAPADSADLAERSSSLTDNIVSETLVEILLRQGKKDKAVEVLKKLIWKFPQKKAIFAAQIEELRK
ncbi:MAG: hypothetical protein ACOYXA_15770 [Bacteroidota bacterium]